MPRQGWKSVSLPQLLIEKIDGIIEGKKYSWKSRADVVAYAVYRLLDIHGSDVRGEDAT